MVDSVFLNQIQAYQEKMVPERPDVMLAMEQRAERDQFPIIGPVVGQFCYQIARMTNARRIFELGSGYGYSTAWFAKAVRENGGGVVHHVVWDDGLSSDARSYLGDLGYNDVVRYHVAEAVDTLSHFDETFDLIFLDILKKDYPASLAVIGPRLKSGGVLLADNVFYHGRIFNGRADDLDAQGILEFNRMLTGDPAWITSIYPVRDGVAVAYKG